MLPDNNKYMRVERVMEKGQLLSKATFKDWVAYGVTNEQAINNMLGIIYLYALKSI